MFHTLRKLFSISDSCLPNKSDLEHSHTHTHTHMLLPSNNQYVHQFIKNLLYKEPFMWAALCTASNTIHQRFNAQTQQSYPESHNLNKKNLHKQIWGHFLRECVNLVRSVHEPCCELNKVLCFLSLFVFRVTPTVGFTSGCFNSYQAFS